MVKKISFLLALAVLANVFVLVFAWAHHLFVAGLNPFMGLIALLLALAVFIPLAVFAIRRLARYLGTRGWMDPAAAFIVGACVYTGYPRVTGRVMNAPMGYLHFAMTFVALLAIGLPLQYIGLAGMPRRYLDYRDWVSFNQFEGLEVFRTWMVVVLICGQLLFVFNLVYSAVRGRKVRP